MTLREDVDRVLADADREPGWFDQPVQREWTEVKRYPATNPDGHEAIVYVAAYPARFYRIVCPDEGIDLATGSSMDALADQIARALADGMLGKETT